MPHHDEHRGHDRPWGPGPPWGRGRPPWGGSPPPWWPEGEDFPPGEWRRRGRRFARRAFGVVLLTMLVVVGLSTAVAVTVGRTLGGDGPALAVAILAGLAIVVLLVAVLGRGARRALKPAWDVMNAAERVTEGDYDVHVDVRGPIPMRRLVAAFNEMTRRLATDERRRRELLADVTHELRTPLAAIRGNLEAMVDGVRPLDPPALAVMLQRTAVMERLLDDLATLSTAEAGALRLHREWRSPAGLIEDALSPFEGSARDAGIALRWSVDAGVPDVDVDPHRIGQVLTNLVGNAVRHTPDGGSVTVDVTRGRVGEVEGTVFSVADTGRGITPEDLPYVFERFVKSADSGGVGLGLTIARRLVEAHGGAVAVSSEVGAGATVVFAIPS